MEAVAAGLLNERHRMKFLLQEFAIDHDGLRIVPVHAFCDVSLFPVEQRELFQQELLARLAIVDDVQAGESRRQSAVIAHRFRQVARHGVDQRGGRIHGHVAAEQPGGQRCHRLADDLSGCPFAVPECMKPIVNSSRYDVSVALDNDMLRQS